MLSWGGTRAVLGVVELVKQLLSGLREAYGFPAVADQNNWDKGHPISIDRSLEVIL